MEYVFIIKMYETGVYKYVHPIMFPPLQNCDSPRTYQSAGLPDLMTAFAIFILGIVFAVVIFIFECLWIRKKRLFLTLKKSLVQRKPAHQTHRETHTLQIPKPKT
ncbi:hypothetical protein NQ315_012193 [Exocentrus adspersus]|uniref:Uncharacterized protein n=1 Tax=Exocentrus adspersus TaxID=1586481 RepID=A0AAV8VZI7_9CUCU|nr:hypothetical protein NQ315_012193 [Exocentrus adspersus]